MFKIGDIVAVKDGVSDPDYPDQDMTSFRGRVTEYHSKENTYSIKLDSISLYSIPIDQLRMIVLDGLSYAEISFDAKDLELSSARDTEDDVEKAVEEVEKKTFFLHLDFGDIIHSVLEGLGRFEYKEAYERWNEFLGKKLTFPVSARTTEDLSHYHVPVGVDVIINSLHFIDDSFGIICEARYGGSKHQLMLADLEADGECGKYIKAYSQWYANM